jgi:hypothetical protein
MDSFDGERVLERNVAKAKLAEHNAGKWLRRKAASAKRLHSTLLVPIECK